jgi:uncharacterized OsmC-like protein
VTVGTQEMRTAIEAAIGYLTEHPDEARYTDSAAVATIEEALRCRVTGPDGASVVTDMPTSVGGGGSVPSPGWLFRAAMASCIATVIAMRAAQEGVDRVGVQVTVDSESDDRGILGMDEDVPAGPLSVRVGMRVASADVAPERLRAIAEWGADHCPVCDATRRAVPVTREVETG